MSNGKKKNNWLMLTLCITGGIILAVVILCGGGCVGCYGCAACIGSVPTEEETSEIDINNSINNSDNITNNNASEESQQTTTEEATKNAEEVEKEYKESCQEYGYKEVLRNPDEYVGKKVKIQVKISNVKEQGLINKTKYYFAYSDNDGSGWYFDDRYAVFDKRIDKSLKLLEDDIIIVYGEISEPQETTSLIVNSEEVFCIDMKYVELILE